jgi:hypothetical protein
VAELLARFRDIRDAVVDVGRTRVGVDDLGIGVSGLLDSLGEVEDGGFGARPDVVRLADGVGRGGAEVGLDDIIRGDGLVVPNLLEQHRDDVRGKHRSGAVALARTQGGRWRS